ncbi:MAG: helix-turn-helix domain-containing protein [Hyphomicrobiaceae bacterium]
MEEASIGAASRATGVKVPTIRYYEEIGLLPPPPRTGSNRRIFGEVDLERLRFIRHARELGFGIEAIRTMIDLQAEPDTPCSSVDAIARERLAEVEKKVASLQALKKELQRMIRDCGQNRVGDCRIIEALLHHEQCRYHGERPTTETPRS